MTAVLALMGMIMSGAFGAMVVMRDQKIAKLSGWRPALAATLGYPILNFVIITVILWLFQ